jgi:pimeloyl-ACP methyl ester carboxylesterase
MPEEWRVIGSARIAASALLVLLACACTPKLPVEPQLDPARAAAGDVARVEALGSYSHLVLRALFWWEGLGDAIATERGVSLYRVEYWTASPSGTLVRASGLLALPRGPAPLRGVVSWQHGTASERAAAPSTPDPDNGVVAAAVFAGHGYLLLAPDYLGFGASTEPHAYYHTKSIAGSVVDLLRAAREVVAAAGRAWPEAIFLTGFSQGGHATLAAQRALETEPIAGLPVRAAAPVAGPVDLAGIALPNALTGRSRFASLYLAWIAVTYARVYDMPLDTVVREPFPRTAPPLFDGAHDGAAIVTALPADPRELLTPVLLAAEESGGDHWFLTRLAENSLLDWTPKAPVRLYYGERDVDVSPEEAISFARRTSARGADVAAESVGDLDHDASILAAAPKVRAWFDSLAGP